MKTLRLLALAALVATTALAQDLTWAEMARRPELWPAHCTLKEAMKFAGGVTLQAGQKVNVLQVLPTEVKVTTPDGQTTFTADPGETDVLAVASAAFAKLTPKQRALTYETLARQKELWPKRVTLVTTIDLNGGKSMREGEEVVLRNIQPGKLLVSSERLNTTLDVPPQVTDLMARARRLVEDEKLVAEAKSAYEKQQANGVVLSELEGKLVNSVTGKPQPLEAAPLPRYVVFYRGSSTCPITRQFTPSLIKYYQAMKPAHPDVEFVWIMTESAADTSKFARQLGFNWRAIGYESTGSMPRVSQPISGLLPQLIVMDRAGRVLANGSQNSAQNALRQLDALLKRPAGGR